MKITFLGTSHGYAEKGRFTSSALIESGGKYYILDAGAPIEYLLVNGEKDYDKIRAVFLTHMHNDHVGSLSSIVEPMLRYRYNNKATCFFPSNEGSVAFSDWLYALGVREDDLKKNVKFEVTHEGRIFDDGDLCVYAKRTEHLGKGGAAFSYVFEEKGKRVLFTGDLSYMFMEYPDIALDTHYDLVVCEGAHFKLCDKKEMLKKTDTDRMIFNHIYDESMSGHEVILKEFPFPAILSHDGMEIEV